MTMPISLLLLDCLLSLKVMWTFHALSLTRQDKPGARLRRANKLGIETEFFPTWRHYLALVGLC